MKKIFRVLFLLLVLAAVARAQQSQVNVLSPTWTVVNYPDFTLDVVGGGFVSGAQVLWNSVPLATTFVNSSELQAQVPSGNLLQPGAIPISVKNADGTISGSQNFTIRTSYAQVDRVIPQAFPATVGVPLTIYGQNFISGAHVVVDGYDEGQGTLVSATQINATLGSASHLAAGYAHQVRVTYPPVANPYGGSLTPAAHTTSPITATVSPAAVIFGNQTTGTTSASAKVFSLAAGASPMSIGSISISGSSTFTQTNNCPATLNPGQYCTVDVKFAPTSATSFTATLTAIDNAQNSPQTAALSGTGVAPGTPPPSSPAVQLSPSGLTFGEVPVSTTSGTMTSVLTNTGTATLTFTSIAVTGTNAGDFTLATGGSNCPPSGMLAASASCNLSVTFNTSTAQDESASITITDNAGDSPESVAMTATGYVPSGSSGCSVAKPTSLLCGQTAEHFSIPSGWTLVLTEGFDSGSLGSGSEYVLNSAGTTPNLSTTRPHSGTRSSACNINFDGEGCALGIVPGTIGSSNHIYVSFWRYMDSNACNNTEIYFSDVYTGDRSLFFDVMDTQGTPGSCTTTAATAMLGDGNFPFTDQPRAQGNWHLPLGTWEQVEFEFKGSTCAGGTPNNDGLYRLYINGVVNVQRVGVNLEGCGDSSVGMAVEAGGTFTYLASNGSTNIAPGNGAFNVYIDDVILLKQ